jgi:hypothetical protein
MYPDMYKALVYWYRRYIKQVQHIYTILKAVLKHGIKIHYFFQSLKGKNDVSAEILVGNLHVDYMGECTAQCTLYIGT